MNTNMLFMSITDLKAKLGVSKLDIVKNPNTGKFFAAGEISPTEVVKIKVQQTLTPNLPIKFMYEPDKFNDGCITNITPANLPVFSL